MKKYVLLVGLTFCFIAVTAQTPGTTLSFDEAYLIMMENNPELKASFYEEQAAEQERKAAFGLRLPQVGMSGAYIHMGDDIGLDFNKYKGPVGGVLESVQGLGITIPPLVLGTAQSLLQKDWALNIIDRDLAFVGGSVTLPVYTGGKINAANRAAAINEKSAQERGLQTKNALVSQLAERYYGLSLAMQVVKVRSQVVDAVARHLRDARIMEENGVISHSSRLFLEVKMTEAERDLQNARLNVQTILTSLCNTINFDADFEPVSLMFILDDIEDVSFFKGVASENNPLLRQVELQRDLAKEGVKVERSEYMPQVALMGGANFYRYNDSGMLPKWAVGAGVKINIFDGLQRERKVAAARQTVKRVESLETKAANDISLLIDNLYNEMANYRNKIPSIDKSMEFAEEYLRIQRIGFTEGVTPATDVIDAELNLATIRIEKLQTAYFYDLMLARLLEASGVSELFPAYARNPAAEYIRFED